MVRDSQSSSVAAHAPPARVDHAFLLGVPQNRATRDNRRAVALTAAVWDYCVAWPDDNGLRDEADRLSDALYMAHVAIRRLPPARPTDPASLRAQCRPRGSATGHALSQTVHLYAGPGDHGEPVITMMLPKED